MNGRVECLMDYRATLSLLMYHVSHLLFAATPGQSPGPMSIEGNCIACVLCDIRATFMTHMYHSSQLLFARTAGQQLVAAILLTT